MTERNSGQRVIKMFRTLLWLAAIVVLVLLLGACGSAGEEVPAVSGTVVYRERIAFPDDAVVTVQLRDVSLMDVEAQLLGEEVIHPDGGQVPIPYKVPYDAEAIDERNSYSMSARIEDGSGKLLFISDTAVPVITRDNPTEDVEIVTVSVAAP